MIEIIQKFDSETIEMIFNWMNDFGDLNCFVCSEKSSYFKSMWYDHKMESSRIGVSYKRNYTIKIPVSNCESFRCTSKFPKEMLIPIWVFKTPEIRKIVESIYYTNFVMNS